LVIVITPHGSTGNDTEADPSTHYN
jgi:hypothetical protein